MKKKILIFYFRSKPENINLPQQKPVLNRLVILQLLHKLTLTQIRKIATGYLQLLMYLSAYIR